MADWAVEPNETVIAALAGDPSVEDLVRQVDGRLIQIGERGATPGEVAELAPDVLLVPLVASIDVLRICREMASVSPATLVAVCGSDDRVGDGYQAMRLGAHSWVSTAAEDAVDVIEELAATGSVTLAPAQAGWLASELEAVRGSVDGAEHPALLTAPERATLIGLARGKTPDELAMTAGVAPRVVHRMLAAAMARLHRLYAPRPDDATTLPRTAVPDDIRVLTPAQATATPQPSVPVAA